MPDDARRIQFAADRGDARLRLDRVLVRRVVELSRMSRSRAQTWIESGAVLVNGVPARRPAARVREGARIEVVLPESARRRTVPQPELGDLRILYEDNHLLAIDKPAGTVVHPSFKHASGTLLNAVLGHVRHRPGVVPGIVTRLDKETSGVVVVALTPGVHAALQRQAVGKEYLAVVAGRPRPARGLIELALGRDERDRRRIAVVDDGIAAATRYQVVSTHGDVSLVRCELVTGRTHQIRVHLAACGWPILGDRVYGRSDPRIGRVALHAWRVRLRHPVTEAALELVAPIPADLASVANSGGAR
jgi:23S rRNA pseudouridine1911/1915/1917 synthase